ncbi:MAG: hypothetical protein HY716_04690 [Planctomycetes bacterium]|nr:hypothetical protein [Planctomycetota bacterium]
MAARFEYRQAREIADIFAKHGVRYLFIGKSGAILLGYPDTTQDADLFVEKSPENEQRTVSALEELGFPLQPEHRAEIERGKDFVQIRYGPFDLDLVFAPDGIETFAEAEKRSIEVAGMRVCHLDDIIRSKEAAGRVKDRESLPRLRAFRDWWIGRRRGR